LPAVAPVGNSERGASRLAVTGSKLAEAGKRAAIALFVPLHFSVTSGHLRSALLRKSVDGAGRPIPWYTFPAVDFLATIPFADASVLEFGSGHSTLWWAERARELVSIEGDPSWFRYVERRLHGRRNVDHILCEDAERYPDVPRGRRFDVVVVDGGDRYRCAQTALDVLADGGLVILDNSEVSWRFPPRFPILELFDEAGLGRVDFYGYSAGVRRKHCTSFFLSGDVRFLRHLPPPARTYLV
jgi:hypothetical protein